MAGPLLRDLYVSLDPYDHTPALCFLGRHLRDVYAGTSIRSGLPRDFWIAPASVRGRKHASHNAPRVSHLPPPMSPPTGKSFLPIPALAL